ncbi:MAG: BrnT family toxin [Methylovulum sp.]|nr:BrnT family toxin [Methylovulum sp.]
MIDNSFIKIRAIFKNVSADELMGKLNVLEVQDDREKLLFDILVCKRKLDFFLTLDIQLYVLKDLFPNDYESVKINRHPCSECDLYEYDPPKNGKNIIKHGISFDEVVSYSTQFGTLVVPCPDENDGTRIVIFSDLSPGEYGNKLSLPLASMVGEKRLYTLSIVQQRDGKFRFISSRVMSRTKFSKTIKNAYKNIYANDPEKKKAFVERSVELLKQHLFRK